MTNLEHYRNFSWNFLEIWNIIKQIRNKMFHNYDPPPFKIYKTHIILPVNLMSKDIRIGEEYTPLIFRVVGAESCQDWAKGCLRFQVDWICSEWWQWWQGNMINIKKSRRMLGVTTMMTREYDGKRKCFCKTNL